jgi:hypothetical protein
LLSLLNAQIKLILMNLNYKLNWFFFSLIFFLSEIIII